MNEKLWGGRFNAATSSDVDAYQASIPFDHKLIKEDILGSLAHVTMLQHCNIITLEDYETIKQGLTTIAHKAHANELTYSLKDEDIHMNIERLLTQLIGDTAGKLHTARSRNDQVALDLHLYLRKQILQVLRASIDLQTTLLKIAREHDKIIMPGYTHLQRAQPIYFALHLQAYIAMIERDIVRLKNCWHTTNISPLGACALAGTTFATDPHYVAQLLAFDSTYLNSMDAVSNRDFIIEFLAAASIAMMHISRLCEELVLWSSTEFNFISFGDAYCTGSSIMPQKKNPDIPELARGKVGRVYGSLFSLLTTLKGLPLAYNKDLQEDKEPLFDTVKTWISTLKILSPLLSSLTVNQAHLRAVTQQGYLNATALAEYLVQQGFTFRAAHEVVGRMVNHCIQKKCDLNHLSLKEMQQFSELFDETVSGALQLDAIAHKTQIKQLENSFKLYAELSEQNKQWVMNKQNIIANVDSQFGLDE